MPKPLHPASDGHNPFAVGSQVVTLVEVAEKNGRVLHPYGAVAVVSKTPADLEHSYRVRFPDGLEWSLKHSQLVLLSRFKDPESEQSQLTRDDPLYERVIFRCVIGSRAYGLDDEQSDTDYRGIYLPTADRHWSLFGVPEQLECDETQEAYWELQKFIVLALKANPNVLECLWSPLVEVATPLASELLAMRSIFLSKLVYQTFNGYVVSQFKKMQSDIRNQGTVKWKHVMHLIRLLITGTETLRTGIVPVRVSEHREQLLAIKRGEVSWDETEKWRKTLQQHLEDAFRTTTLPERPDYEQANAFLIRARQAAMNEELP
jgi:predicted nucleotidyltransferase